MDVNAGSDKGVSALMESLSAQLEALPLWGKSLIAGGVALGIYLPYSWYRAKPRQSPIEKDYKPGMIYLYQYPRTKNIPSICASCLSLETWLRIADIPYQNVKICPMMVRGLDGAMPFVELNGEEISQSADPIREIKKRTGKGVLEEHLTEEQAAACVAFERLLQQSLRTSHLIFRVENAEKVISLVPSHVFGFFAPLVSKIVQRSYIGQCASALSSAGFGSLTREQQIAVGQDDLQAISTYLGAKHYFTGFKPTAIDAALFGVLAQIVYAPYESSHEAFIRRKCTNLIDFIERIKSRYWPDWKEATTSFSLDSSWKKKKAGSPKGSSRLSPRPKSET